MSTSRTRLALLFALPILALDPPVARAVSLQRGSTLQREIHETPEGHSARSGLGNWRIDFDGRGFTVLPAGGKWIWGLQLDGWGRAGELRKIGGLADGCAEEARLEYGWSGGLTEWYSNETQGLEHGFTLYERPGGAGPLVLELEVRGDLEAVIDGDGRGCSFQHGLAGDALRYAGLHAFDARGRELPARMLAEGDLLRIEVEDGDSPYPIRIDPVAQEAYIKASNTGWADEFGYAIAISGDTLVVGAFREASNATGVNGNQLDNSMTEAGAVYVFVRSGGAWSQQAYIKASNTESADLFGWAVAVSGDTLVVGASDEDSNATGVNGNQADNSATHAGAAYVFVRNGGVWSQQAYLKASNTNAFDYFGSSVSISGDSIVVGAYYEDSSATGVNGNELDNGANNSGAAYVFVRNGGVWSQEAYLKASNTDVGDSFGLSVSISGDSIVVGALSEDSAATGVNGNQLDNSATLAGAAYVFTRSAGVWSQQAYLKASNTDPGDWFGYAVGISGDSIVVGAVEESSSATGVNGNQQDNTSPLAGAAYVFTRNAGTWSQDAYLKASNTDPGDRFGRAVAISGDLVVVAAPFEASNGTGVNGNPFDNSALAAGAAYTFRRNAGVWGLEAYIKASNTDASDFFGVAIAASADMIAVGAGEEDSSATGVNGNQFDNSMGGAGAAYTFWAPMVFTPFCFGDGTGIACPCANSGLAWHGCENSASTGGAVLSATGIASLATDTVVLTASGELPHALSIFLQGTVQISPITFGDGLRCTGGLLKRLYIHSAVGGVTLAPAAGEPSVSARSAALGSPITAGTQRFYQTYYRDPVTAFCPSPSGSTWNVGSGLSVYWDN